MVGLAVSGIMLSRYALSFLHMLCAYWGFCVMSLHLGLHWGMVLAAGRRAMAQPPDWGKPLLRVRAVLISLWGVYAFIRREMGVYLLLQTSFVFFDFEEPLALFLLDYLSVMGLFAAVGYYAQKLLFPLGKREMDRF